MNGHLAYVGSYTHRSDAGITRYHVDGTTGEFDRLGVELEVENPSYLSISSDTRYLFAVSEREVGRVVAAEIERPEGTLRRLGSASSGGAGPCYCGLDATGRHLLVANYAGGSVAVVPVDGDGSPGDPTAVVAHSGSSVHRERQTEPHPHAAVAGPDNRFVYVPDLGTDTVEVYRLDGETGTLDHRHSLRTREGAGPRHLRFHPDDRHAILLNEINSTLVLYERDPASGALRRVDTAETLPADFAAHNQGADLRIHPSGRWVYASNRGHDSVVTVRVDADAGVLEPVDWTSSGGESPRHVALDPTGTWLYALNRGSDSVVRFRVDGDDGTLDSRGVTADPAEPACLGFCPR